MAKPLDRLAGFRRVELGDWQRPKLHLWVERLDRAIRESPRRVVFAGHSLGCLAVAWWAALNRSEALFDRNDPQAGFRRSTDLARSWGCSLVDAGEAGQLNASSGLGAWPTGLRLIAQLSGHDPAALVARVASRFSNVRRAQETAA